MKISFRFKILMLACVGISSSIVTSTIMAQMGRNNSKVNSSKPAQTSLTVGPRRDIAMPIGSVNLLDKIANNSASVVSGSMTSLDVQSNGMAAMVVAKARVRDTRPNVGYVWMVKLTNSDDDQVVYHKMYENNIYYVNSTQDFDLNFSDEISFEVIPGIYNLEIAAYMVTPKFGLEGCRNPDLVHQLRGPKGRALITLHNN